MLHTTDTQLTHKYQLLRHKYTLIDEEIDRKKTHIAKSYEQLADSYILLNEYYWAKEHLIAARKLYEEFIHFNRDNEIKTIDTKMKNIDKC